MGGATKYFVPDKKAHPIIYASKTSRQQLESEASNHSFQLDRLRATWLSSSAMAVEIFCQRLKKTSLKRNVTAVVY